MIRLLILWHDFWWWCECKSGKLWMRFCPADKASYWLDWLPAFCLSRRARAQFSINRRGYTVYGERIDRGQRLAESARLTSEHYRVAKHIVDSLTRPPDYYI